MQVKNILILFSLIVFAAIGIFGLGEALTPLILSAALAYFVFPLIKKLENKGIKREIAVLGTFSFIVFFILGTFLLILPGLITDSKELIQEFPTAFTKSVKRIETFAIDLGFDVNLSKNEAITYIKEHISGISTGVLKSLSKGLTIAFGNILNWFLAILNIFLIPLFFFYIIIDFEKSKQNIKELVPVYARGIQKKYSKLANQVLSGYLRGQFTVAMILSVLYGFGLWASGLKFGLIIGLISGMISIIPYAGFTLGFLAAIIMGVANFTGVDTLVGIIIVFAIVQVLEGFIITPKLVGDKVGLSPFVTILVLIIGGNLFGLLGMLLAIPVGAIAQALLQDLLKEYKKSNLYI